MINKIKQFEGKKFENINENENEYNIIKKDDEVIKISQDKSEINLNDCDIFNFKRNYNKINYKIMMKILKKMKTIKRKIYLY